MVAVNLHDLRHEATSRLAERGWNVLELAAVAGHQDLQMLKRYTNLRAAELAKKMGGICIAQYLTHHFRYAQFAAKKQKALAALELPLPAMVNTKDHRATINFLYLTS